MRVGYLSAYRFIDLPPLYIRLSFARQKAILVPHPADLSAPLSLLPVKSGRNSRVGFLGILRSHLVNPRSNGVQNFWPLARNVEKAKCGTRRFAPSSLPLDLRGGGNIQKTRKNRLAGPQSFPKFEDFFGRKSCDL